MTTGHPSGEIDAALDKAAPIIGRIEALKHELEMVLDERRAIALDDLALIGRALHAGTPFLKLRRSAYPQSEQLWVSSLLSERGTPVGYLPRCPRRRWRGRLAVSPPPRAFPMWAGELAAVRFRRHSVASAGISFARAGAYNSRPDTDNLGMLTWRAAN